ncbi:MAG: GNAT family N-acetyltransferase [Waterburya sp.]
MPKERTYSQAEFPDVLKWQALAFMRTEWPYIFEEEDKFLTETYEPELDPVHFVITEGDLLISYAAVVRTTLEHAGHIYQVCGFGNMFTFPPHRREGHGHRLLRMATEMIRQSEVDLGILYCDPKIRTFYMLEGWATTGSPTRFGNPSEYENSEEQRMMIFLSDMGKQNKTDFEKLPLYVDWTW